MFWQSSPLHDGTKLLLVHMVASLANSAHELFKPQMYVYYNPHADQYGHTHVKDLEDLWHEYACSWLASLHLSLQLDHLYPVWIWMGNSCLRQGGSSAGKRYIAGSVNSVSLKRRRPCRYYSSVDWKHVYIADVPCMAFWLCSWFFYACWCCKLAQGIFWIRLSKEHTDHWTMHVQLILMDITGSVRNRDFYHVNCLTKLILLLSTVVISPQSVKDNKKQLTVWTLY